MPPLKAKDINPRLKAVLHWRKRAQVISRTYKFAGFLEALDFVKHIAKVAQKNNHHPDIDIRFNQVKLAFTTHDEGGLTPKDFSLAEQCDEIFGRSAGAA
jgi:4a-hydroxytetrahydrobiopterin dehydratase